MAVWRPKERRGAGSGLVLPPALRIVGGLILLVALGTLLLMLPGVGAARPLSFREAFFTAISALSVTGLSLIAPGRDLTIFGQLILLLLIQIGGIGFMVLAVVLFWLLGRKVSLLSRLALSDSLGLSEPRSILSLTRRVLVGVLAIEGVGALLLFLNWRAELGTGRAVFYAIFHAVSSFCNAGFDLFSGLAEFPGGPPSDGGTMAVFSALIMIGGLGIPVMADLLLRARGRRRVLTLHTRITLAVSAALWGFGWLGIYLAEARPGGVLAGLSWERQLLLSLFQSISSRTAGFAGLPAFDQIQPATQLVMMILMFVGCAPASVGGGITTGTLAVLSIALWSYARGLPVPRVAGRQLLVGTVQRAAVVLSVSLAAVLGATLLILLTHQTTLDKALFEVVSAFATCGLTLAFTNELNDFGLFIISMMMLWGRVGALTIFVALAQVVHAPSVVSYPEESVLIG